MVVGDCAGGDGNGVLVLLSVATIVGGCVREALVVVVLFVWFIVVGGGCVAAAAATHIILVALVDMAK